MNTRPNLCFGIINYVAVICRFMLEPSSDICESLMAKKQTNEEKIKTQEVYNYIHALIHNLRVFSIRVISMG